MQISSANVLASQQATRAPRPAAAPAEFQPLEFKKTAATDGEAATEPSTPSSFVRPGTYVDLKI